MSKIIRAHNFKLEERRYLIFDDNRLSSVIAIISEEDSEGGFLELVVLDNGRIVKYDEKYMIDLVLLEIDGESIEALIGEIHMETLEIFYLHFKNGAKA